MSSQTDKKESAVDSDGEMEKLVADILEPSVIIPRAFEFTPPSPLAERVLRLFDGFARIGKMIYDKLGEYSKLSHQMPRAEILLEMEKVQTDNILANSPGPRVEFKWRCSEPLYRTDMLNVSTSLQEEAKLKDEHMGGPECSFALELDASSQG